MPVSSPVKKQKKTFPILVRAFGYLRPYRWKVVGIYLVMLLISGIAVVVPQLIGWIVDYGIQGENLRLLGGYALGLLALVFIKGLFVFIQGVWTEEVSQYVAYDLRNTIQRKLTQLSFAFHDQTEAGQILSRSFQDVERIRFLTGRAVLRLVEGVVLLCTTAGVLIWMNQRLGLIVVLLLPLLVHRGYSFGRQFRPLSIRIQDQLGVMTTRLEQNLRGIRVVKSFAQEEAEIERFEAENEEWFGLERRSAQIRAFNVPLLDLVANLGTVIILWYGGRLVVQGTLSLGELVAFITYLGQLVRPARLAGRIIPILAIAASSGERIFEILDTESSVKEAPNAVELTGMRGDVCFDEVSFGYRSGHTILENIDFKAQSGQVVALLGATGSGKSTVINLLTRFYDPDVGRVMIDGIDIRQISLNSLRSQIGIVLQDTNLFAASIRDNIAFGKPDAPEEMILTAAREAQADGFIRAMPEGYETTIGERGVTLSGGQKQRLAIARALLVDPRILILDDATSSVDTQTEGLIQQAMSRLMEGRTTFVIAHRLSTVRRADLILLLEKGQVIAQGAHRELLDQSDLYREVYQRQLRTGMGGTR